MLYDLYPIYLRQLHGIVAQVESEQSPEKEWKVVIAPLYVGCRISTSCVVDYGRRMQVLDAEIHSTSDYFHQRGETPSYCFSSSIGLHAHKNSE